MAENYLRIISKLCLANDEMAEEFYRNLSRQAPNDDLKGFWKNMASEEKKHVHYWRLLVKHSESKAIPAIFENPEKTVRELEEIKVKTEEIVRNRNKLADINTSILMALRLEFYLLHPAFGTLFQVIHKETGAPSPEDEYDEHINHLIEGIRQYGEGRPELKLIGEIIERLWKDNRQITAQLSNIKILKGMIPICAACKSIRDDKGFWNQVESYIHEHTEAEFTHSICPECRIKLYQDYEGGSEQQPGSRQARGQEK